MEIFEFIVEFIITINFGFIFEFMSSAGEVTIRPIHIRLFSVTCCSKDDDINVKLVKRLLSSSK